MRKDSSKSTIKIEPDKRKFNKVSLPKLSWSCPGFTLIELLVVMAIIATLLSIVAPRYFKSLDRSKETVLRQDLNIMRDSIDKFYGDTGKYPLTLNELVERRYLRAIPVDPVTENAETWIVISPPNDTEGVYDVRSGSPEKAQDGTSYETW